MTTRIDLASEDVELVAGWFKHFFGASVIRARDRECAREILATLADAGRILPPDTYTDEEYQFGTEKRTVWVGPWEPVEENDIDATGHCCCAGCIGMGPCDLDLGESVEEEDDLSEDEP